MSDENKPKISQEQLKNRISVAKEVKEIKWPSTKSGGVMPMSIESRFEDERHRLSDDYTKKWRQYRVKYLQSLVLKREEPRDVPQLRKLLYNPIRRFYHAPLNFYEKLVIPYIGKHYARTTRNGIALFGALYTGMAFMWYNICYSENANNWETYGTIQAFSGRPEVLPGDKAYPMANPMPYDWQFNDKKFSKRKSHLDL